MTRFSVIITTYNRVHTLPRAVESVLAQDGEFELIIVDDGSTDGTSAYLEQLDHSRVQVVTRRNGGLGAARNTGLEHATGEWVVFLDDDDVALPAWLKTFEELIGPSVGVVCCAAEYFLTDGSVLGITRPKPMGTIFADRTALFLAGAFACRTDLLRAVGGYDEEITCSHQTDLALRLTPRLTDHSLTIMNTDDIRIRLERRNAGDRPLSDPTALYHGTRHLLEKHRDRFAQDAETRARTLGVLGVSAARLERWSEARAALLASARAEPLNARRWMRLATVLYPPLARLVWRSSDYGTGIPT